ncbi:hypothetical protein MXMO3_01782 [Maritalea myrionectae]|uniref:Uncharacterized protein n=1 Tax=Maritalea myrionectae TaxID=454601 RepID=A0A2R4ME44_9HYPH|nr:hypothetical protein [Maritalea myrionectae]AVX04307.1 hypothetical protein MXMO3_01782 [Maritalea myrionectae]
MIPVTASDCREKIKIYTKRRWPLDNDKSAAPKLQIAINNILRDMTGDDEDRQSISVRRAKSYLNGESSAKLRGWEVAAIRELLEGATDDEKQLFDEIEELRAVIARQGKIIDRLTHWMDSQGS